MFTWGKDTHAPSLTGLWMALLSQPVAAEKAMEEKDWMLGELVGTEHRLRCGGGGACLQLYHIALWNNNPLVQYCSLLTESSSVGFGKEGFPRREH